MRFKVVGSGEVPKEPYYENGWWTEPLVDESTMPYIVKERLEAAKRADKLQGYFVRHEAPKQLMAPKEYGLPDANKEVDLMPIVQTIVAVLLAVGTVIGWIFMLVLQADPVLVCVCSDGSYVEVARWSDSISS